MASKQLSLHHLIQFPNSTQKPGDWYSLSNNPCTARTRQQRTGSDRARASSSRWSALDQSARSLTLGPNSYEWFRVKIIGKPEPEQVPPALETIDHFIDEILSVYPIDPQKLFLLGFSQGSLLSMCYALTHPSVLRESSHNQVIFPAMWIWKSMKPM